MTGPRKPLVVIDDDHHAGIVIIIGSIALVISLICSLIRLYVRTYLSPPFARDDYMFFVAIVFAIIQTSLVMSNSSKGFGDSIHLLSSAQVTNIQQTTAATDAIYLITVFLSKCCVLGILSRLTPQKIHHSVLYGILGLSICWVFSSVLAVLINCHLNRPWAIPVDHCSGLFARWKYITSMDIIIEVALFLFSVFLVKGLQMSVSRKLTVLSSFAVRLPLIAFSSLHFRDLAIYAYSNNPTLAVIDRYVWAQLEMNFSLIVCTAFCLAPFMRAISTDYGTAGDVTLGTSSANSRSAKYGKGRSNASQSYVLQSVDRMENNKRLSFVPGGSEGMVTYTAYDGESRTDGDSVASAESTKMIIRKNVEISITHERT